MIVVTPNLAQNLWEDEMGKAAAKTKLQPLRLDFRSERTIVVVPEDEDRFVVTSREAARACRRVAGEEEWRSEFNGFLTKIHNWCGQHPESIDSAYLAFGDEGLKVFMVTIRDEYDFSLDDEVAKLGIELAKSFPGCPADVLHVPNMAMKDLHSFFSPSTAIQLYAQPRSP
jgi:hypothetical protein